MRVITGIARGRKLRSPDGYDVRPTTEITKEALFSILQFELEGAGCWICSPVRDSLELKH